MQVAVYATKAVRYSARYGGARVYSEYNRIGVHRKDGRVTKRQRSHGLLYFTTLFVLRSP